MMMNIDPNNETLAVALLNKLLKYLDEANYKEAESVFCDFDRRLNGKNCL